jgi:hypothetical protein
MAIDNGFTFLYGFAGEDYGVMVENNAEQISAFIMKHRFQDSQFTNPLDVTEITTSGEFIFYCRDQEFLRTELIPVLVPMQRGKVEPTEFIPYQNDVENEEDE